MSFKKVIKPIPRVAIDASTFAAATFYDISAGGIPEMCIFIRIRNETKDTILISWNPNDPHDVVLSHSYLDLFFLNTDCAGVYTPQISRGVIIQAANLSINPNVGYIYLTGFYQENI